MLNAKPRPHCSFALRVNMCIAAYRIASVGPQLFTAIDSKFGISGHQTLPAQCQRSGEADMDLWDGEVGLFMPCPMTARLDISSDSCTTAVTDLCASVIGYGHLWHCDNRRLPMATFSRCQCCKPVLQGGRGARLSLIPPGHVPAPAGGELAGANHFGATTSDHYRRLDALMTQLRDRSRS
jgi:hypothetical protein